MALLLKLRNRGLLLNTQKTNRHIQTHALVGILPVQERLLRQVPYLPKAHIRKQLSRGESPLDSAPLCAMLLATSAFFALTQIGKRI
jgi:hypothetical protein